MRKRLLFSLFLTACTSGSDSSGLPFTVEGTGAMVRTNRRLVNIELTSFADSCSIADEREHPNTQDFRFMLADFDAQTPPTAPGTFTVYTLANLPTTGLVAECGYVPADATCTLSAPKECSSGTVTLTRVDAAGFAGTYDVVFDGHHVTGSFDAPSCPDVSESGFGTCQ